MKYSHSNLILGALVIAGISSFGLNIFSEPVSAAHSYYVSPDGNDAHPGTAELPWKSIAKVNQSLKAGDTALFLDGRYDGRIMPSANGMNEKKAIVYRSANLHGAVLIGEPGQDRIVELRNKQYITVDGFEMRPERGGFGNIKDCHHIVLKNCHMEGSTVVYSPLIFMNSDFNRMINNTLTRAIRRLKDSRIHGDGCHFINSSYNVIEGNKFSKIGHSPLRIWGNPNPEMASHNVIRGNFFHNGWGRNFELFNLYRSLFEKNIITDAFHGAMSADPTAKMFFNEGIIRHCLVYDNWDNPLVSNSYTPDGRTNPQVALVLKNSRIYNNTFAFNPSWVWKLTTGGNEKAISSNIFLNNIFYKNDLYGDGVAMVTDSEIGSDKNRFYNNLFYGDQPGQAGVRVRDVKYTAGNLDHSFPIVSSGNLDTNPEFINETDRYFMPGEGSPVHNAGRPLTLTTSSGTGKVVPVADAVYFFDGFGIEGEKGDLIIIGKEKEMARVVNADLDKNELTLDREVTWTANSPVSLPHEGSAPGLGALQYGNTGVFDVIPHASPAKALTGESIAFKAYHNHKTEGIMFKWDFGDGTYSVKEAPEHVYDKGGDYIVTLHASVPSGETSTQMLIVRIDSIKGPKEFLLKTGFEEKNFEKWAVVWHHGRSRALFTYYPVQREDGQGQKMCVSTEGNNRRLTTQVRPRVWDIDKYPIIRFSYQVPKGVPVGVWLETWETKKYPNLVCVGGSPSNSSGKYPLLKSIQLTDDGKWHEAELDVRAIRKLIPELKMIRMFQFSTFADTHEGQKFWFDDFGIYPETVGTGSRTIPVPGGLKIVPNPMRKGTEIDFQLEHSGSVSLAIYDTSGQKIKTIISEHMYAGNYSRYVDTGHLLNGVYVVKLTTDASMRSAKMVVM